MSCNKIKRDYSFNRAIVNSAVEAYVNNYTSSSSQKNPLKCMDLSTNGEVGKDWLTTHGPMVNLISPGSMDCEYNECLQNKISNESKYSFIEKTDFNVIYIECTTEGSTFFDCVFRKISRKGLFAISTFDDPALYGRPPDPALRCYGGNIVRTYYAPEMAVRLIIAAMARSAARFSKCIDVLLAIVVKNSIVIIVSVTKGAVCAVECLKQVKTLLHCSICEERAFLPDNQGYIVDNVKSILSCECTQVKVGKVVMVLGPLWAGPIGSPSFINKILLMGCPSLQVLTFMRDLHAELCCDSYFIENYVSDDDDENNTGPGFDRKSRKRKLSEVDSLPDAAPVFYYNIHKHKPDNCCKLDKIIRLLRKKGLRCCRTHFDRTAVKTSCNLKELLAALSQAPSDRKNQQEQPEEQKAKEIKLSV